MFKFLQPYLNEQDTTHSSQRLVYIVFAFLILIISFSVIIIAFTSKNVELINALTMYAGMIYGFMQGGKVISKFSEQKQLSVEK